MNSLRELITVLNCYPSEEVFTDAFGVKRTFDSMKKMYKDAVNDHGIPSMIIAFKKNPKETYFVDWFMLDSAVERVLHQKYVCKKKYEVIDGWTTRFKGEFSVGLGFFYKFGDGSSSSNKYGDVNYCGAYDNWIVKSRYVDAKNIKLKIPPPHVGFEEEECLDECPNCTSVIADIKRCGEWCNKHMGYEMVNLRVYDDGQWRLGEMSSTEWRTIVCERNLEYWSTEKGIKLINLAVFPSATIRFKLFYPVRVVAIMDNGAYYSKNQTGKEIASLLSEGAISNCVVQPKDVPYERHKDSHETFNENAWNDIAAFNNGYN